MNARATPTEAEVFGRTDLNAAKLRTPPHSIESESTVLGGLLLNASVWDSVADIVKESDFYRYEHRLIFRAIGELANSMKPCDVIAVWERLEANGKDAEVGGLEYLNALAQFVPSASNIRYYATTVREKAVLRKLISASDEIASAAFNTQGRSVASVADEAEQAIFNIIESDALGEDEWASMDTMIVRELDHIQERADSRHGGTKSAPCIPTGMSALDELLDGGMRGGQLIIIGARPGMGKSAIADTIGLHVAMNEGLPVGKFSMEMQNQEGAQRALASVGRIPLHAIRRPERMSNLDWSSTTDAVERLRNVPFFSNETGGLNINQIRTKARVLRRRHGLGLLVVDYLQLMSGTDPRAPRTYQLEEASRGLKSLAKELNIPIVALVQVNRGVEKEVDQMPRMSDIKDCGAIEQDADVILFLHRPIVAKPELSADWRYYAQAHLAKQRGGRTGKLDFMYVGENTRFMDWPADQQRPVPLTKKTGSDM